MCDKYFKGHFKCDICKKFCDCENSGEWEYCEPTFKNFELDEELLELAEE